MIPAALFVEFYKKISSFAKVMKIYLKMKLFLHLVSTASFELLTWRLTIQIIIYYCGQHMLETRVLQKGKKVLPMMTKSLFAIKLGTNETIMALCTKNTISTHLKNIHNVLKILFKQIIPIISIYLEYSSKMQHKFHNDQ